MTATLRQAREWAIQILTAADLNPGQLAESGVDAFIAAFWETLGSLDEDEGRVVVKGKHKDFAETRVKGVLEHQSEIDAILKKYLEKWDLYRLGTIERCVLRLGVWELTYSDVPKPVVINEAIDLTNWFAAPKSRTLVNGVLDKYAKAL